MAGEELRTFTVTLAEAAQMRREFPEILTEDTDNLIYVNGLVYDAEDLSYGEKREIRRIIRQEVWDEDIDGPYDETRIGENESLPALILVFMRRTDPEATIEQAMAVKPREAYRNPSSNGASRVEARPTSSPRSSTRSKSAGSGSRT